MQGKEELSERKFFLNSLKVRFFKINGRGFSIRLPKYRFLTPSAGIPVNTQGETYPREFIKIARLGFSEHISPFLNG